MHEPEPNIPAVRDPRAWAPILARFREPSCARSTLELIITAVPFVILWILMWAALGSGYWVGLLLAVPAAGFLVRLFMIQHDCGHGSFFRSRPNSGNLDHRGFGDVDTLTVREFLALPRWRQLQYRLYRHPIVMFGIGPAYLFILRHRFPVGLMRSTWRFRLSTMATNLAIAILAATVIRLVGVAPFLLVQLPITLIAGSIGVWLFYVQHQFEDTFWAHDEGWTFHEAALHGSSHYDLPNVLRWFTANIGVHHVHHLCSRIPYYRLPRVLRDHPELAAVGRLTLLESLRCVRMVLWDERSRRLVSFREMRAFTSVLNRRTTIVPNQA
jgi:acyl-lipid omega-6 desaturase (Delta-12 desaturase)